MVRRLRDAEDLLAPAVAATISKLALTDEDAAAVKLARRYAATIDEAADIAAALAAIDAADESTAKRVNALAKRVKAQAILTELGPNSWPASSSSAPHLQPAPA